MRHKMFIQKKKHISQESLSSLELSLMKGFYVEYVTVNLVIKVPSLWLIALEFLSYQSSFNSNRRQFTHTIATVTFRLYGI